MKNNVHISVHKLKELKKWSIVLAIILILVIGAICLIFWGGAFSKEVSEVEQEKPVFLNNEEVDDNWKLDRSEEFFVEYRLERERVRSKEVDMLQQMVNNPNTSKESKREAEEKLLEINKLMEAELNVENSLIALGYENAILFFQNGNANVVVNAEALTREEKAKIAEIVSKATGVERYQVTITEKGN